MKVETFQFRKSIGWSVASFPAMDSPQTVLLLFGAPDLRDVPEAFSDLEKAYPLAMKMGCSTSGEIFGNRIFDESLSVAVIKFSRTEAKIFSRPIGDASQSFAVGELLASDMVGKNLASVFVLSDGLKVNGSQLIRGINHKLPPGTIVTGGLAGDGSSFKETWVIQGGKPVSGFVTALCLYGKHLKVSHCSKGGWDIFGPERLVTKSEGNVLFEIDGKPALQLYKDYLGEKSSGLPASALLFPLQIRSGVSDQKKIVRTILNIDEEKQAMIFAGDIPQGHLAQLMRANFDRLIEGAARAGEGVTPTKSSHESSLLVAISCVGRRLVLGERTEEEVDAILEKQPDGTKVLGFYSYGELSPYVENQPCELHNQTMTLTSFSEDEEP